MIDKFFRTKPITILPSELRRCLSSFDLILLGIGAIIGAGIFILTGIVAATKAGPGVVLSFAVAGIACSASALAYAELAASIGGCGSAYSYAYAGFGELIAWIIGWDLLLEYGISCPTVAIGWSGYAENLLRVLGLHLPPAFLKSPFEGGIINLPAVFIVLMITILLIVGVKQSSRFNNWAVVIKLSVIALFVAIAIPHVKLENWQPFLPFGWQGVISGAAIIFFAYIGFDAVSTAAEETIDPQRNLPIGIMVSLSGCTLIYILVSGLLTGAIHYSTLNVSSPVAYALIQLHQKLAAAIVSVGAVAGLTTVILVMYYGFTRVFLAMARDGLLPETLAHVNPITQTPIRIISLVGIFMMGVAGFLPLSEAAELVNIGTLAAFALVSAGVVILRYTQPDLERPFKVPLNPIVPLVGTFFSLYLMMNLSLHTWLRFIIWFVFGLFIYLGFGQYKSKLNVSKSS